jgi:bifunctional DNase/RNase
VIEMIIDSIRVSLMNYQRVVILKEKETNRYLPIWIGPAEADAIAVRLQDVQVARPLTHDLVRSMIETLGGSVHHIVVNDLTNDTFFARIILNADGHDVEVDSRPSDAIALAVRVEVPIFVEESVLDKAGVVLDQESGEGMAESRESEPQGQVGQEELEKLAPFRDIIESLNLEDLGKGKGEG